MGVDATFRCDALKRLLINFSPGKRRWQVFPKFLSSFCCTVSCSNPEEKHLGNTAVKNRKITTSDPGVHKYRAKGKVVDQIFLCTVVNNTRGPSVRNLMHVTLLALIILKCLLGFWGKFFGPSV
jgi:hypothetical protein